MFELPLSDAIRTIFRAGIAVMYFGVDDVGHMEPVHPLSLEDIYAAHTTITGMDRELTEMEKGGVAWRV